MQTGTVIYNIGHSADRAMQQFLGAISCNNHPSLLSFINSFIKQNLKLYYHMTLYPIQKAVRYQI